MQSLSSRQLSRCSLGVWGQASGSVLASRTSATQTAKFSSGSMRRPATSSSFFRATATTGSMGFTHSTLNLDHQRRYQSTPKKDLYKVLGVQKGATPQEIKKAYLQKAKKLHPDVNPSKTATEEFAEVKQAHDILGDANKKQMYDMTGNSSQAENFSGNPGAGFDPTRGFNPFAGGPAGAGNPFANMGKDGANPGNFSFNDFEDIFSKMAPGQDGQAGAKARKPQGPEPGADIHFKLKLSFLEAVNGASKEIAYNTFRKCATCGGGGAREGSEKLKCAQCNGRGKKVTSTGFFHMQQDCTNCGGTGETGKSTCTNCSGRGNVKDRAVQTLPVPKGVNNRERLKVTGKGEAGVRNGPPGNLFVEIQVDDHPVFHRDGNDIHVIAPVSLSTAILGGSVRIKTLTSEIETKVPSGTQQGDKLVLRGRGVQRPNQNKTGDFYIHFAVQLPKELTAEQKKAMTEFAKSEKQLSLTDPQLQELKNRYKSWFA